MSILQKIVFAFTLLFSIHGFSQIGDKWNFQGILYGSNYEQASGTIYIQKIGEQITIRREFLNETEDYLLFSATLKKSGKQFIFTETQLITQKIGVKNSVCKAILTLEYEEETGYWKGSITSRQCRILNQRVIGYFSVLPFNLSDKNHYNNYWITEFQNNLWKGYPSPEMVKELRKNFQLFTVYFDYDKAEIRAEYLAKLKEMTMIIDSHSDLRIQITGHTDWDGSNQYNDTLSRNRAIAIKNYFMEKGIDGSKIQIDYKGKRIPIADNKTDKGKQLNRRVILEFISNSQE